MKSQIFYDGNCVVCDIEIAHYKRIAPDVFELVDISEPGFDASKFGFDPVLVNRELHVMAPNKTVYVGVQAFRHIWSRIADRQLDRRSDRQTGSQTANHSAYRWLSRVVGLPGVLQLANIFYGGFVRIRPYLPKKATLKPT